MMGLRTITGLVLLLSLGACAKSPEDAIQGEWFKVGGGQSMQFYDDGTIVINGDGKTMAGNYTFLDEETLRIDLGGIGALAGPLVANVAIENDELSITLPDRGPATYSRTRGEDYSYVSKQVSEGLNLSGGAKAAVTEFFLDVGRFPESNTEAGLVEASGIVGYYVSSVAVSGNQITVTYSDVSADDRIAGKSLVLAAEADGQRVTWSCSSPSIDDKYLPAACH